MIYLPVFLSSFIPWLWAQPLWLYLAATEQTYLIHRRYIAIIESVLHEVKRVAVADRPVPVNALLDSSSFRNGSISM